MVTLHYENFHLCHWCVCVPSLVKLLANHFGSWKPLSVFLFFCSGHLGSVQHNFREISLTSLEKNKTTKNCSHWLKTVGGVRPCFYHPKHIKTNNVAGQWNQTPFHKPHTPSVCFLKKKNINCTFSKQVSENFRRHPNTLKPSLSSLVSISGQSASSPSFIRSFSSIFWPVCFLSDPPLSLLVPVFSV